MVVKSAGESKTHQVVASLLGLSLVGLLLGDVVACAAAASPAISVRRHACLLSGSAIHCDCLRNVGENRRNVVEIAVELAAHCTPKELPFLLCGRSPIEPKAGCPLSSGKPHLSTAVRQRYADWGRGGTGMCTVVARETGVLSLLSVRPPTGTEPFHLSSFCVSDVAGRSSSSSSSYRQTAIERQPSRMRCLCAGITSCIDLRMGRRLELVDGREPLEGTI